VSFNQVISVSTNVEIRTIAIQPETGHRTPPFSWLSSSNKNESLCLIWVIKFCALSHGAGLSG